MNFPRPRSLNELILVGFGLVALPLLIAVLWALFNLDHLATQSEQLVFTGVAAAENNRLLAENAGSLERVARQFTILRDPDSLLLLQQDLVTLEVRLGQMQPLAAMASATTLLSLERWSSAACGLSNGNARIRIEFRAGPRSRDWPGRRSRAERSG